MKNTVLIGIDPGLGSLGFSALFIAPDGVTLRVDDLGAFETQKSTKKQHVLATEDNLRRARDLAVFLGKLFARHGDDRNQVVAVCAEAMSWPRNAGSSAKIGIAWGVLASVAWTARLPILQASPQAVKKELCGRRDASKEEIQEAVMARVQRVNVAKLGHERIESLHAKIPKTKREHPFDALAVSLVCMTAEAVQIARRVA